MISAIRRYLKHLTSNRAGRRGTVFEIVHDEAQLSVSWLTTKNETRNRFLTWAEVTCIKAFKRDLYAVDLICLVIESRDGSAIQLDEEMVGWNSLIQKLPEYLAGCKSFVEWFELVAFPAFQLNMTPIFKRVP